MVKRAAIVEIGRVAVINYGPDAGKIATIIDVVDSARALIDGPTSGVKRQTIPFTRLSLTNIKYNIPRSVGPAALAKAFAAQNVEEQWRKSSWAKKAAIQAKRKSLTDFDRFKVMVLRKKKSLLVNKELAKLRRKAAGKPAPSKKVPIQKIDRSKLDKSRAVEKPKAK